MTRRSWSPPSSCITSTRFFPTRHSCRRRRRCGFECAVIPYILRLELLKLDGLWAQYPAVADWWGRMRARPSVKAAIFDRMKDNDWAPFNNLAPDPWPKVQELVRATA